MDYKYKYLKYKKKYIELVNKLNSLKPINNYYNKKNNKKYNKKYNKGKAIRDSYSIGGYNKKYIKI
jgi:hypothetical protein